MAEALTAKLETESERVMSVASYLEAGTVMAGRHRTNPHRGVEFLDAFIEEAGVELYPVNEEQAHIALDARIRFGRGMGHGGVLNFGDVFSYALAKSLDAPLLYVGRDFAATDVTSALD